MILYLLEYFNKILLGRAALSLDALSLESSLQAILLELIQDITSTYQVRKHIYTYHYYFFLIQL